MSGKAKLVRSLYRSFLKWTRAPHVSFSPFEINGDANLKKYLPPGKIVLRNAAEVNAVVQHAFRNAKGSSEEIDDAFQTLRRLNEAESVILKRVNRHRMNFVEPACSFAFGEPVEHIELGYRGVVIDKEYVNGSWNVSVLVDEADSAEHASNMMLNNIERGTADSFGVIKNKHLKRITNSEIHNFFKGFDVEKQRFIPRNDMAFLFPRDSYEYQTTNPVNSPSFDVMEQRPELKEFSYSLFQNADKMHHLVQSVIQLLEIHGISMPPPGTANSNPISSIADSKDCSPQVVLFELFGWIQQCQLYTSFILQEEAGFVSASTIPAFSVSERLSSPSSQSVVTEPIFSKKILLGPESQKRRMNEGKPFSISCISPFERYMVSRSIYSKNSKDCSSNSGSSLPLSQLFEAFEKATNAFSQMCLIVDRYLQLRFQSKGVSYMESLLVKPSVLEELLLQNKKIPGIARILWISHN